MTYSLLRSGSASVDLRELGVDERVWRHVAYQSAVGLGRPCQVEVDAGVGRVELTDWPATDTERSLALFADHDEF